MKYENTIYLKAGTTVKFAGDYNLAEVLRKRKDWERGTMSADGMGASTSIPFNNVAYVHSVAVAEEE